MKIIEKQVTMDRGDVPCGYVFIDIETTGLAKEKSNLYLVGLTHRVKDNDWVFKQWLIESPVEEGAALDDIAIYLKTFDTLVHFNGDSFDLPYLDYHARVAGVESPYLTMKSLDLYKKLRNTKSLFFLGSAKQKSFEFVIGCEREDKYGGGELIKVYYDYLADRDDSKLHLLLIHNEEDVLGMTGLINLLPYARVNELGYRMFSRPPKVVSQTDDELLLHFDTEEYFKYKINRRFLNYYLVLDKNSINLKIPVEVCEKKYFFPNPADYYYLPKEDIAVHKSVGQSVDPAFREPAKKYTCYARKTGPFIPLFSERYGRVYKGTYWELPYTLIDDELLSDTFFWNGYMWDLFSEIRKDLYLR